MPRFSLLALASLASALVYEAELATFTGGVHVASDVPGYTGTGYVAGFAAEGDTVRFAVSGITAGSYDIAVVYSAQSGDKFTTLTVNGVSSEVAITNVTTSTWATSPAGSFPLTASNAITLSNSWGWYFIDSVTVSPTDAAPVAVAVVDVSNGAKVEAESGIFNGVTAGTTTPGFSGNGFVQGFDAATDSVTITLYSATNALYDVVVGYAAIYGEKQTSMSLNGAGGANILLADTTTAANPWANATAGQVLLTAGNNTISFTTNWGWYFIDVVYVTPSPPPAPHQVTSSLVVPDILPVAQALFNKLLSKYSSGEIFSGQAEQSGVSWLEANVGKTPAIIGLDMMDYSPSRVQYGTTSTAVEEAIAFDARNGMVAFQWHWNAPSHLINNETVPWWRGFYSYGTTFNLTAALATPSSTEYALLISDMDAIATQLLRLQAANVPVLWRPLHEADGTWFWWGAYGPESAVALYRLMFDRFTNHHNLRNLIWVWNSVTPSWYPGDDVVDILGYDSYPPLGDHGPVSAQYQQLIALGRDKKLVTLPEVGIIPDPDILKLYHADWSYFVTWSGEFIETETYNSLAFKRRVYNDPAVLKLTDLGNWKGSATATSLPTSTSRPISTTASKSSTTLVTSATRTSTPTPTSTSNAGSSSTKATSTSTVSSATPSATATQVQWGQCGGANWSGPTVCVAGTTCVAISPPWFSQCV